MAAVAPQMSASSSTRPRRAATITSTSVTVMGTMPTWPWVVPLWKRSGAPTDIATSQQAMRSQSSGEPGWPPGR